MADRPFLDPRAKRILTENIALDEWPQPGGALGLIIGLFSAMLILAVVDLRQVAAGETTGFEAISNISAVIMLLSPLFFGLYAAKLPRDTIRERDFAYTYCARCPRWVLLQGFSAASLYRMRLTLALVAGAAPFFADGLVRATLQRAYREGSMVLGDFGDVVGMLVFFLAIGLSFVGVTLLMTAIGTLEGLRGRPWGETVLRILLPMVLLAFPTIAALMLAGPIVITPFRFMTPGQQSQVIVCALVLAAYPFAAFFALARTRAEKTPAGG